MKTSGSFCFIILLLMPFIGFAQGNQANPPAQQMMNNGNLYNGNSSPVQEKNEDNNPFIIHKVIQSNQADGNMDDIKSNGQQQSVNKFTAQNFSSGGGASSGKNYRFGSNFRRSIILFDKRFHKLFGQKNKKGRSNASCFSWSK